MTKWRMQIACVVLLALVPGAWWGGSAVATRREKERTTLADLEGRIRNQRRLLDEAATERKEAVKQANDRLAALEELGKAEPQRMVNAIESWVRQADANFRAQQQAQAQAQGAARPK